MTKRIFASGLGLGRADMGMTLDMSDERPFTEGIVHAELCHNLEPCAKEPHPRMTNTRVVLKLSALTILVFPVCKATHDNDNDKR